MSLLDQYSVDCVTLIRVREPDPVGGYTSTWTDGVPFGAAWEYESAPEITVAEQQGVARQYNIYVDKSLDLDYHEYFRRLDTGETYRVVNPGADRHTPASSRLNRRLIAVEKAELPRAEGT